MTQSTAQNMTNTTNTTQGKAQDNKEDKTMKPIHLPEELYDAIMQLKEMFRDVSQNDNLTEVDVVATLVAGFMDGVKQQNTGSSGVSGKSCSGQHCGSGCKSGGECCQ